MLGKLYKYLAVAVWLLTPTVCFAGPETWAAIATWLGEVAFAGVTYGQIIFTVAVAVYGSSQQRKAAADAQEQARHEYNAGLRDRTITRVATEAPHRYIYGTARVGSDIVGIFSSGDKDQYKHLVCVHAAHECEAIDEIYIAGEALGTLDVDGNVTQGKFYSETTESFSGVSSSATITLDHTPIAGSVFVGAVDYNGGDGNGLTLPVPFTVAGNVVTLTGGAIPNAKYSYRYILKHPHVRVQKHLGTPTDPADATLLAEVPDKWTATATLRGYCYTVIRLDLNQAEFQGGLPPIEPVIRGKKLYDPRTGLTTYSSNPALAIYDYLTSEICGVPASDLPVAQYITAANVCDEITVKQIRVPTIDPDNGAIGSEVLTFNIPKYAINGTVTSDQNQSKMLEAMAQCMAGSIVSTTWDIMAGKYVAPVMALYQEDIVGTLSVTPGISDADLYNGIKGQYIDPANKYVATDFTPYQNATFLATDGRDLFNNIDFQFTNDLQSVHNLCRIFTEDQRNGFTIKAEFSMKAWGLKVGQRVTFTSPFLGQTAKVYRITDKKYSPSSAVELTMKEDSGTIWDYADSIVADETPNTDLPNPYAISPLASITCTSGSDALLLQNDGTIVSRIFVEWPEATTQAVLINGIIEVQWQAIGATVWQSTQASGDATSVYLSPVLDGEVYIVRARCVNPYFNVKSDWAYSYAEAIGKTASPPDVASMTIKVKADGTRQYTFDTTGQPVDVKSGGGYRIKYRLAGTSTAWADMTPLHTGLVTQSPYETNQPLPGVYDFGIESVDSTGNGSLGAYLVSDVVMTDGDFTDAKTDTAVAADVVEGFIARINALISANKAETAQATADAATADITNIVSDSVLAKGEKSTVILDYNAILGEQAGIDAQATALGITTEKTTYDNAVTALTTYLTGLSPAYNDTTTNTAIVAATFRQKFVDVYTAKQVLMNMFASKASTLATWTGIVSSSGTISTGNVASIIGTGALGTTQIADQAIATAKLADLATTTGKIANNAATTITTLLQALSMPTMGGVVNSNTLTFTTSGRGQVNIHVAAVVVNLSANNDAPNMRVYFDGVQQYGQAARSAPNGTATLSTIVTVTPSAASHTVYVDFYNGYVYPTDSQAIELKVVIEEIKV